MQCKLFNYIVFIIVLALMYQTHFAQEVEFSGFGAAGFKFYNRNILNEYNQETYYEGKLQADIIINKQIDAQLDLRGNSTDNSVNFREFSVKFDYFDYLKFKVGNIKKPFTHEYNFSRDALPSVERSNMQNNISEFGYGDRSVSIMAYYKYKNKKPEFPYTYYISIFKNNALLSGVATRFGYHFNDDYSIAASYMLQQKGGENKITTNGFGFDFVIEKKNYTTSLGGVYVQDPVEGILRLLQGMEEDVYAAGAKLLTAYKFHLDAEIIKSIEPLVLLSYYVRDIDVTGNHTIQALLGANFYFNKKVRLRFNGDLRLTKNQYNDDYSTKESRGILEVQVRF